MKQHAKAASTGSTQAGGSDRGPLCRALATRAASDSSKGSGAPSSRRLRATLAVLALVIAGFAITAASASADPLAAQMDTITDPSYTSAQVTGKVTTPGAPIGRTAYSFEYCADGLDCADDANWVAGPGGSLGDAAAIDKKVEGLLAVPKSGKYFVRLSADTLSLIAPPAKATSPEPYPSFTTLPVDPPTILATDDASEVFSITAKATGKVKHPANKNPAFDVTKCRFEYISDAQFTANEGAGDPGFKDAAGADCAEISPENPLTGENAEKDVSAQLPGLKPATTYHLRLIAENASPTVAVKVAADTFTTPTVAAPTVTAIDDASGITYNSAEFTGKVLRPAGDDPGLDTKCRFEYITDAQFTANEGAGDPGFDGAQPVDCAENPITADKVDASGEIEVSAKAGLLPETTYHLRLVAENAGGSDAKVADTFTTPEAETPTVTIDPLESGIYTAAHVTGTVTLDDGYGAASQPVLQSSVDGGSTWNGAGTQMLWSPTFGPFQGEVANGLMLYGDGLYNVEGDVTGMLPSTTYLFRIASSYNFGFSGEGGSEFEERGEVGFSPELSITTEPPQPPPTADNLAVTDVTATSAHFSGTVDPHAPAGTLSGAGKKAFATHWEFVCVPECKDKNEHPIEGTVQGEEGAQTVTAEVRRLEPGTEYTVSLVVSNEGGGDTEEATFPTSKSPPSVKQAPGASDGSGGYTLQGIVNPNKETITDCEFRWGPASNELVFKADCSPLLPDPGAKPTTVEAHLTDLNTGVDYYSKLVVTYAADPVDLEADSGPAQKFRAELAAKEPCPANEQQRVENKSLALPECRAYEMVSPSDKEGWSAEYRDHYAGTRVLYKSGAGNLAHSGQNELNNDYVANRTGAGWNTIPDLNGTVEGTIRGLPSAFTTAQSVPKFYSEDLLTSIWSGHRSNDAPGENVYLRGVDGTFTRIGSLGNDFFAISPFYTNSRVSGDLSHLFVGPETSSGGNWGPGVYEFVGTGNDQPRRADVDNFGVPITNCVRPLNTGGYSAIPRFSSRDGRVFAFTVIGGCSGPHPGNEIWARVNGTTSFDISASQCSRTSADPGGACNGPIGEGACYEPEGNGPIGGQGPEVGPGCRGATYQGAATDGSRIFFTTARQLLNGDTDQTNDLYACDIPPGTPTASEAKGNFCSALTQVSDGGEVEWFNGVSGDGSTVLFTARGVLADNEDALGQEAVAGDRNLYVWHAGGVPSAGQTSFLGRVPDGGLDGLGRPAAEIGSGQATPDGRYVVFTTAGQLTSTDTDSVRDVYRYDVATDELTRVSVNSVGLGGNNDGTAATIPGAGVISDDGQKIAFITSEALWASDGNEEPDLYLWTPQRVSLISTGEVLGGVTDPEARSGAFAISGSGQDIFFETPATLSPADGNDRNDVYDARINGGFSFAPKPICNGEECQPRPTPGPIEDSPLSAQPGPGNPSPPKPCRKGKVRNKKSKCVRKHAKKHGKKSRRKAGHNPGGSK